MKKNKPKSEAIKNAWPGMAKNPFALNQPGNRPNQFQVKQVQGRRSQRGR